MRQYKIINVTLRQAQVLRCQTTFLSLIIEIYDFNNFLTFLITLYFKNVYLKYWSKNFTQQFSVFLL